MTGPGTSSSRSCEANSAKRTVSPLIFCSHSIADVLQEPLGWDLPAEPLRLGEFIDAPRQRPELVALQVAALRIGDLVVGGAALTSARDDVSEGDGALRRQHGPVTTAALGLALEPSVNVRTGRIGEVFIVDARLGTPRRRRIAEPQIKIDAIEKRLVLDAVASARCNQMRALLDPRAVDDGDCGIGERRHNIGVAIDLVGAVTHLHLKPM